MTSKQLPVHNQNEQTPKTLTSIVPIFSVTVLATRVPAISTMQTNPIAYKPTSENIFQTWLRKSQ